MMDIQTQIKGFEGSKLVAYPDPGTGGAPWTDGNGHTGPEVHPGTVISQNMEDDQFQLDFNHAWQACVDQCRPWFTMLCEPRQAVLVNMTFEAGTGILRQFAPTVALISAGDYEDAAAHIRSSLLYSQAPRRWETLATQLVTGVWP